MKTIGLIGGMSWESTLPYYRHINEAVRERLGGLHSARLVLYSLDFQAIETLQREGDWQRAGELLGEAAQALQRAGADFLVLATNTMHKVADAIAAASDLPLLHIAEPTAAAVRAASLSRVALLGTRFTMEQDFYRERLQRHGLQVLIPEQDERLLIHRIIYEELCQGRVREESRQAYRQVVANLVARGAEGVVLGCTEIGLLLRAEDAEVPLFDTCLLHARAAAARALA
ncbi:aspartate/glutamate racemase family protein [Pseudomonas sp. CAU 1711]|uniref:aspartate/glutamate racemase family protein n=1 Tax=Pseudomonas sp. CAU 1711 TaxID=3140356 RepID=UPI003261AC18